ncbi:MAG: hypothetical protein ABJ370_21105 [Paracoccaceae bacterium]
MIEYRFYIHDFHGSAEKVSSFLDFPNSEFSNRGERDPERVIPRRSSVTFSVLQDSRADFEAEKKFFKELMAKEDRLLKVDGEITTTIAIICSDLDDQYIHLTLSRDLLDLSSRLGCEIDFFVDA